MTTQAATEHETDAFQPEEIASKWRWLRDDERRDPSVLAHLEAENAATDEALSVNASSQELLTAKMEAMIPTRTESVRMDDGEYEYWSAQNRDDEHSVSLRRRVGSDETEIVLDANLESAGEYLEIGDMAISDDNALLAWTADRDGSEEYQLQIRRIATGEVLYERANVSAQVEFSKSGNSVYTLIQDEAMRPYQVLLIDILTGAEQVLVEELDERFHLEFERSSDENYLIITAGARQSTRVWAVDRDAQSPEATVLAESVESIRVQLDHFQNIVSEGWIALSNQSAAADDNEFHLAEVRGTDPRHWPVLWQPAENIRLEEFQPRGDGRIVVQLRVNGTNRVGLLQLAEETTLKVLTPALAGGDAVSCTYVDELNPLNSWLHVAESSLAEPERTYRILLTEIDGGRECIHREAVGEGYTADRYETGCLYTTSHDGTQIRMTYLKRKDLDVRGAYLYGYGAYGTSMDPEFIPNWTVLADQGLVPALAHVRGGGEEGERWHAAGRLEKKSNTFHDFAACGQELRSRYNVGVVARGGSAGGLLIGATLNLYPELFAGAIAEVPFVDVLATMQDPTLPLTVGEYEEWGNPNIANELRWLESICPITNVRPAAYPPVLATTGLHDPRVGYWEAAIWTQVLRAASPNPVLLRVEENGHGGASARSEMIRQQSAILGFALSCLGLHAQA